MSIVVKAPPAGSSGSGAGSASPPPAARDLRAAYEAFCVLSGVVPPADWEGLVWALEASTQRRGAARAAAAIVRCRCHRGWPLPPVPPPQEVAVAFLIGCAQAASTASRAQVASCSREKKVSQLSKRRRKNFLAKSLRFLL